MEGNGGSFFTMTTIKSTGTKNNQGDMLKVESNVLRVFEISP